MNFQLFVLKSGEISKGCRWDTYTRMYYVLRHNRNDMEKVYEY